MATFMKFFRRPIFMIYRKNTSININTIQHKHNRFTQCFNFATFRGTASCCLGQLNRTGKLIQPTFAGFLASIAFFKKENDTEDKPFQEDQVILILKHAKLAEMKGEYDQAGKYYHRALGILATYQDNKTWDSEKILQAKVHVYDNMANLALAQGKFKQAEKLYTETMKGLLEQNVEKDDNTMIEISLKLSMIYAMQGKHEEAEKGYMYAIDMQEKKMERESTDDSNSMALLGMCINSYSRFLMLRKKIPEAQEQMEKAVTVAKRALGDDSEQVAVLLNDVANMAMMQGDYDYALEKLENALALTESSNSQDIPAFYCNIGEVYIKKGDLSKAKKNCNKAFKIAQQNGNKEAKEHARSCLDEIKTKK